MVGSTAWSVMFYKDVVPPADFPSMLKDNLDRHPWKQGKLLVTEPPYSAKGDGVTDDTEAVKAAISDAYESDLDVYFPSGTYLVSESLRLTKTTPINEDGGKVRAAEETKAYSLIGAPGAVLKLKDGATVTDNTWIKFQFVKRDGRRNDATRSYSHLIRGLTLDAGRNPDVTVLSMDAAQASYIQSVTIVGQAFDAGIEGLPGSGGLAVNVSVRGGNVGLRQRGYRPTPTVSNVRLVDQARAAVEISNVRGSVVLAGFSLRSSAPNWIGVRSIKNFVLVDGEIVANGGKAIDQKGGNAYLENVVITGQLNFSGAVVEVDAGTRFERLFYAKHAGAWVNGEQQGAGLIVNEQGPGGFDEALLARHGWTQWTDCLRDDCILAAATVGNDSDDDAVAINEALKQGKPVQLPRGVLHIKQPIVIPEAGELIGAGQTRTLIKSAWVPDSEDAMLR
ncbi:MAG: glycoside hydrolase family 55 protein, partial [Planctomycetes bacterium]|nr:glycoside hydrolase family 55 protein [Planctomycetota bacterium]